MKLSLFVLLVSVAAFAQQKKSLFNDTQFARELEDAARQERGESPTLKAGLDKIRAYEAEKRRRELEASHRPKPPPPIERLNADGDARRAVQAVVQSQEAVKGKCDYRTVPFDDASSAFRSNIFSNPQAKAVDFRPVVPQAQYEFKLTVMIDKTSGWTEQEVNDSIAKMSKIYAQCGIRVGAATVVTGDYRPTLKPYDDNSQAAMAHQMPNAVKPWLFLIDHRQQSEFNGGAGTSAAFTTESTGNSFIGGNRFMKGAAFIAKDSVVSRGKPTGYTTELVIGHELAHILTDGDHQAGENGDPKHLLADNGRSINGKITAQECAQMRASPYVRKL